MQTPPQTPYQSPGQRPMMTDNRSIWGRFLVGLILLFFALHELYLWQGAQPGGWLPRIWIIKLVPPPWVSLLLAGVGTIWVVPALQSYGRTVAPRRRKTQRWCMVLGAVTALAVLFALQVLTTMVPNSLSSRQDVVISLLLSAALGIAFGICAGRDMDHRSHMIPVVAENEAWHCECALVVTFPDDGLSDAIAGQVVDHLTLVAGAVSDALDRETAEDLAGLRALENRMRQPAVMQIQPQQAGEELLAFVHGLDAKRPRLVRGIRERIEVESRRLVAEVVGRRGVGRGRDCQLTVGDPVLRLSPQVERLSAEGRSLRNQVAGEAARFALDETARGLRQALSGAGLEDFEERRVRAAEVLNVLQGEPPQRAVGGGQGPDAEEFARAPVANVGRDRLGDEPDLQQHIEEFLIQRGYAFDPPLSRREAAQTLVAFLHETDLGPRLTERTITACLQQRRLRVRRSSERFDG